MSIDPRIEAVAEAIYRNDGGVSDSEYIRLHGKLRRLWRTDAPWDSQPTIELCEHERDDYRAMARAALEVDDQRISFAAGQLPLDMTEADVRRAYVKLVADNEQIKRELAETQQNLAETATELRELRQQLWRERFHDGET